MVLACGDLLVLVVIAIVFFGVLGDLLGPFVVSCSRHLIAYLRIEFASSSPSSVDKLTASPSHGRPPGLTISLEIREWSTKERRKRPMGKKKAKHKKDPNYAATLIVAIAALVGACAKLLEAIQGFPW